MIDQQNTELRFETYQGPGLDLMVVKGHPKHALLFLATQVVNQAGLKDGKRQIQRYKGVDGMYQIKTILEAAGSEVIDRDIVSSDEVVSKFITQSKSLIGPRWKDGWVCSEALMHRILLRGNGPMSEPFRQWVTAIVLPSLRRIGSYTYLPEHGVMARLLAFEHCYKRTASDSKYAARWSDVILALGASLGGGLENRNTMGIASAENRM